MCPSFHKLCPEECQKRAARSHRNQLFKSTVLPCVCDPWHQPSLLSFLRGTLKVFWGLSCWVTLKVQFGETMERQDGSCDQHYLLILRAQFFLPINEDWLRDLSLTTMSNTMFNTRILNLNKEQYIFDK